jgi:O-antigen ligase
MFFGLPFSVQAIGLFFLIQIILLLIQGITPLKRVNKLLLLPVIFYIIHIISWFYSTNKFEANFDLQVKFSFLAIPLLFALKKEEHKIDILRLIKSYTFIALIAGIGYIVKGFNIELNTGIFPKYMVFSHPMHPSYLAMYFTVNIAFASVIILKARKVLWIQLLSIFISFTILYLAESKAGLIAAFALILFFLYKVIFHKNKKLSIAIIIFFAISASSITLLVPRFNTLLTTTLNYEKVYAHPEKVVESTALRLLAWDASLDVIKENPITGVGAGDIKDELAVIYAKNNYAKPLKMKMNCHNQFLETSVGQGIIGLSVLLLMIFALFINKNHKFISQLFAVIIATNILFESMFNVQAGVVFFVFIYSMIISSKIHKPIPQEYEGI